MKKYLNKLLILLLSFVFLVPSFVSAADENDNEEVKKEPVKVYVFRGEGCPHCEEGLEWFESIEEEYGDYFDLTTYEVWYDSNNGQLMSLVGQYFNEEADGIPYIIIGKHTYSGFDSNDSDTLIGYIMEEYEKDEEDRTDAVSEVIKESGWTPSVATEEKKEESSKTNDLIIGLVGVVLVVGIVVVIIKARQD